MSPDKFETLRASCDSILVEHFEQFSDVISITWLHVLRNHPNLDSKYLHLFCPSFIFIKSLFKLRVKNLFSEIKAKVYSLAKDKTETRKNFYNLDRLDILFVSHLVSVSHLNIAEDFYYGNLNDELSKNNFKYAYALIDYTNDKNTSKYLKASNTPRIILQKYLSYKGESCIYKRMRQCKRLILGKMPVKISKFDGRVWKTAAENATSGQSMHSLRVGLQIGSLIKKYKPKMIRL